MTTVVFFCWAERGVVLNEALHKPFEQEGWDTCCKRLRRSMALRWDSGSQKRGTRQSALARRRRVPASYFAVQ